MCKQREDIRRHGECTDNEKGETVISDCSEMRTEGTSRPSVGLVGTARDDHLPVSIPGVMILKTNGLRLVPPLGKHLI